ncbi:glyoxylate/hydroxypyruvate reductase A [Variibacter gotjawalensis]|uniref:Glyoxylate/hydroxypyruvate reductase A n=1 Tax=Variibacter gotjawalensis TaxID=1333996 RepID=A0A0S3PQF5_9BRAD|nr:glyoxylate/hydroxypyruvate reductase A [Variibacter gotjawalensis]NIK48482.1 glyoxylate/hydroxypyruvate reductase A [Variibacter gotjawalensis]RZS50349.1 glyoxylate/hydroxypyruvate reductase A [Variibacter gotjawalensis]BAT58182.1 glyoxylate/hydroxypyruvate reductase A [Variibacter gotjawalensis]
MSALLVAVTGTSAQAWYDRFREAAPQRDIRQWPDEIGDPAEIAYVAAWKAPHGLLKDFPNLKAVFNLGAGVDQLMADPNLPDVPIGRAVHPDLTMRMTEWVTLHVLLHHRRQPLYMTQQTKRIWKGHDQPAASDVSVGVMGVGEIGADAAEVLARLGFRVAGWSRTAKKLPGIEVFAGMDALPAFLARTEILVVLLPATPETEGILSLDLFRQLKRDGALGGAYVVNAGRGKLQVDADIVTALDQKILAGVSLDVFPVEPLPADSPLWAHPGAILTPHNAGDLSPRDLASNVIGEIGRLEQGKPLQHAVDRKRGY